MRLGPNTERNRIITISIAMLMITVVTVSISWIQQLYTATLEHSRQSLEAMVLSQVSLIEAVAEFDPSHRQQDHPKGVAGATLDQMLKAYSQQRDFGESGELVVGQLNDQGYMTFLQPQRHQLAITPIRLINEGSQAEPMRLALQGQSGSILSEDYRGEKVVAAYAPIPSLAVGLVAKIDLQEIQQPFYSAVFRTGFWGLGIILFGGVVLFYYLNPWILHLKNREAQAIRDVLKLQKEQQHSDLLAQLLKVVFKVTNEASTTTEVFELAIEEIGGVTEWSLGHVYLQSTDDPKQFEPTSWWYRDNTINSEMFEQITMETRFERGIGLPGRVAATGKTVLIADVTEDVNFPRQSESQSDFMGIRGGIGIPILVDFSVYAVMEFFSSTPFEDVDPQLMSILDYVGFLLGHIIERKNAEIELQHLHSYHQLILHSVGEGIVGLDVKGNITFMNENGAKQLASDHQECLEQSFEQTFQPTPNDGTDESELSKVYREGAVQQSINKTFWRKDGMEIPVEYTCSPVYDEEETIQGGVLVFKDISQRLQQAREQKILQDKLLLATHEAGKSEIASGILHNVGNVLNSTNIAAATISEDILKLEIDSLVEVADLFAEHAGHIQEFLTTDPSGQQIPTFLGELARQFSTDREKMKTEATHLLKQLDHIRSIIAAQQKYANHKPLIETFDIGDIIKEALNMAIHSNRQKYIVVECVFGEGIMVQSDRHKIMQILINLFHNARHALLDDPGEHPCVSVTVTTGNDHMTRIDVKDNGLGIAEGNLMKLFEYGFTTKPEGNGYGLHSAILAAQELGGTLEGVSEGPGKGATFSLIIPTAGKHEPAHH